LHDGKRAGCAFEDLVRAKFAAASRLVCCCVCGTACGSTSGCVNGSVNGWQVALAAPSVRRVGPAPSGCTPRPRGRTAIRAARTGRTGSRSAWSMAARTRCTVQTRSGRSQANSPHREIARPPDHHRESGSGGLPPAPTRRRAISEVRRSSAEEERRLTCAHVRRHGGCSPPRERRERARRPFRSLS